MCAAAALAAGVMLGADAREAALRSCATVLRSGDLVLVRGRAREGARPGRNVRITLDDVHLERPGREGPCRVPRLVVFAESVAAPLAAGRPVTVRGEWVLLSHRGAWPLRPGRGALVTGRLAGRVPHTAAGRGRASPAGPLEALRVRASRRLRARLPSDVDPLGRALVLAERDEVPGPVRARFVDAGLAHLLAISGLHVGIVAALVSTLLAPLFARRVALGATAGLVWAYVLAIGAPPSAVRSAFLVAGWMLARLRGRPPRTWDLLGIAALVALVRDPLALSEPGLQLSFAGFAGLGAGNAAWRTAASTPYGRATVRRAARLGLGRRSRRRAGNVVAAAFAGFGAFAATAPIAAAHFQRIAPVAVVSHFAGAPLVAAAIASLGWTLVAPDLVAGAPAGAATVSLRALAKLAAWLGRLPGAHSYVSMPGPVGWSAVCLTWLGLARFLRRGRFSRALVPLAAAGALVVGGPVVASRLVSGRALLCTLDVGQGDAAALRTGGGRWILFDAGPAYGRRDAGRDRVLPLVRRSGRRAVALFVLSHPDLDHLGGFRSVLDALPVHGVLDTGDPLPKPGYLRFLARLQEEGVRWTRATAGDRIRIDDVGLTVLGPVRDGDGSAAGRDANESSLQLRVTVGGGFVYLNTGDATSADELALLERWPPDSLRADLLKIGHHGSRTATDPRWLAAVRPAVAVISAGRGNAYGHPHPLVLLRVRGAPVGRVWRTDRHGTLCLEVERDGRWRIQGEAGWRAPAATARVLTSEKGGE